MAALEGVGIGLRKAHYDAVLATKRRIDWLEIISENFMGLEGRPREVLHRCRERWPIVPHGVALSLGSEVRPAYVAGLAELVRSIEPPFLSDHLCFSSAAGVETFDLLPLPRNDEVVAHVRGGAAAVTRALGVPLYLEGIAYYAEMPGTTLPEPAFLRRVLEGSGLKLLLDVNNLYVNATNHGFDPFAWLAELPRGCVGQIHLAGHRREGPRLLDTHDGPVAVLIEWDARIPDLDVVLDEADKARRILEAR